MSGQSILTPIVEFGPCMRRLLAEKGVSASELARMMAYKSRNSIFRILEEKGGHSARAAFLSRLFEEDPLKLTPQERAQLEQALEISRVGAAGFLNNCAMRELLSDAEWEADDAKWTLKGTNARVQKGKESGTRRVDLIIIGCCDRSLFEELRERLFGEDVPFSASITHFIYTGEEEIVRNISAIQPLLYMKEYSVYTVEPGAFSREKEQLYRGNHVFVCVEDEQGRRHEHAFMLVDKGVFCGVRLREGSGHAQLKKVVYEDREKLQPLKSAFPSGETPEDYVAYTEHCRRLEHGKTILIVKPDVPITFIHPDILVPAVIDGFRKTEFVAEEKLEKLVERLYDIHLQRWKNYFGKRKTTHTIFTREQMERFAQTGMQGDHFYAMRPYTPEERVVILTHIRDQAGSNPYFRIHFFKPDFPAPKMEIALFEGAGTLLNKPYTDYDLSGDHVEALIAQDEFCACYKEFFMHDLLERHVLTQEETIAVLDELIEIARNA